LFETNEFTQIPQLIVYTYAIPTFGEINPAVFTNITFPFLFGVMFGDILHGSLLLMFAGYLCMFKGSLSKNPNFKVLIQARYILLMMGIFATFMGLIYNDFTSIPLSLFGKSCYTLQNDKYIRESKECVYPFGIDPVWLNSANDISFYNSFKMKISVILGVMQMVLGVVLKGLNAIHFKKPIDLFHEVLPQLLMLVCLCGFMDFLIFKKWFTDYTGIEDQSPSIIAVMINLGLNGGKPSPMSKEKLVIDHQEFWSKVMMIVAVLTPPWMLFAKPFILKRIHENKKINRRNKGGDFEMAVSPKNKGDDDDE
jgi:V-type H+-transporting ATPase subunit a